MRLMHVPTIVIAAELFGILALLIAELVVRARAPHECPHDIARCSDEAPCSDCWGEMN